jgi:hypothetical protein
MNKRLKAEGGRRKSYVGASASPNPIEVGDRVNAELQHAHAASEMQQVGVPALAGLNANRKTATAERLELTTCNLNLYSFRLLPSAFSLLILLSPKFRILE